MKRIKIFLFIFIILFLCNIHAATYTSGDVNADGTVNASDYILIRKYLLNKTDFDNVKIKLADVNNDNKISAIDYIMIRKIILKLIVPSTKTIEINTPEPTNTPTPTNIDTTKPTIESCIAKISSGYKTTYTIKASDSSGISKYVHNNKEYTTNTFTIIKDAEDDSVRVYDNAGNYSDIICTYNQIIDTNKTIVDSYNSSTLKYWIEKPNNNYRITHIWVKDAYNQLKTSTVSDISKLETIQSILTRTIKNNKYEKKGLIAINASASIISSATSDDYWNYNGYSTYKHSSRAPIIIVNGQVIRNFTNYTLPSKLYPIYGLKSNSYLSYYRFKGGNSSYIENNKLIAQNIINDGVKYTFSFNPVLVENYENKTTNMTSSTYTDPNIRQALCQIDRNNYIIISSYPNVEDTNKVTANERRKGLSFKDLSNLMVSLNCRTGYNLDGGGSLNYYYKKNTGTVYNLKSGNRLLFDILYFVEE